MNLTADRRGDERGVTPIVAVVVLFGLIVFAATLTAVAGVSMIDAVQTQSSVDHAENSMQQIKSDLDELSSTSDVNRTGLTLSGIEDGQSSVVDDGTMSFAINEGGSDECPRTGELDIGTLEYEEDGRTVGFQAGGVWGSTERGATMVAPPDLRYDTVRRNGETVYAIDFPVTNVNPDASSAGSDSIDARQNRTLTEQRQRELQENLCLATGDDIDRVRSVTIRIEDNRYADAWTRFLEDELMVDSVPENDVTVQSDGTVVAHAKLGGPESDPDPVVSGVAPEAGIQGTSTSGELDVIPQGKMDGYDSSERPYGATPSSERYKGKVVSATDVVVKSQTDIWGDVISNESIDVRGNGDVTGAKTEWEPLSPPASIDADVNDAIDAIESTNHNDETTAIQSRELDAGSHTLDAGVYDFDDLRVESGETLTLNTSGGDVLVGVGDDVDIDGKVIVEGAGDGQGRLFADGDVDVADDANVTVTDDRAPKNVWYCTSNCRVSLGKDSTFVGLLYGPDAEVDIESSNGNPIDVYGAITGELDTVNNGAQIHYDTALEDADLSGGGSTGTASVGGGGSADPAYGYAVSIDTDPIELNAD